MKNSTTSLDLILVPAQILERVVAAKLSLLTLSSYESLLGILTPDDVYFYNAVNKNINKYLPPQVTSVFGTGDNLTHSKLFTQVNAAGTDMYMTTLPSDTGDIMKILTECTKTRDTQSPHSNSNNYVGQYFAIDKQTIGAVLEHSDTPATAVYHSMRNLMSLLYDEYLIDLNPRSIYRNNSARTQALSGSGLLAYYCSILNHR